MPEEASEDIHREGACRVNVFLSGPMRGIEDHNKAAFDAAEDRLRSCGHEVWNPCRLLRLSASAREDGLTERECLAIDLTSMLDGWDGMTPAGTTTIFADAVVVLPGWSKSRGSTLEVAVAHEVGIDVKTIEEVLPYE